MEEIFRKEIKYVISKIEFLKIKKQLDLLMIKDTHGKNGTYFVRSQYYDSLKNQDLYDNLDGLMEKRKIRLRLYSLETENLKLEYKCKSNRDSKKYSINISKEDALEIEKGNYEVLLNNENDLSKTIYLRLMQGGYKPKTIIEYNRTAYFYPIGDFRITFDTEIKATLNPYGLYSNKLSYIPILDNDIGILEIKYNNFIPSTLKNIIQQIDRLSESSSKYSKARMYL